MVLQLLEGPWALTFGFGPKFSCPFVFIRKSICPYVHMSIKSLRTEIWEEGRTKPIQEMLAHSKNR